MIEVALPGGGLAFLIVTWTIATVRHRSHLSTCGIWVGRLSRLERRLTGSVTEVETFLESGGVIRADLLPEELVGTVRYLYAVRRECNDLASEVSRHGVRLRWPDGYLNRATLAGRRCEAAHGALREAATALASAAREYERAIGTAADRRTTGTPPRKVRPSAPVTLLDAGAVDPLLGYRREYTEAMRTVCDVLRPGDRRNNTIDGGWPIFRSELETSSDPYGGEPRPMAWTGFGDQPLLHVDAQ